MNKKHLLSVAVASILGSGAAFAGPSVNIYGDLDASVAHTDVDAAGPGTSTDVESFESKIGITGGDKISKDLRAFYRAEFSLDLADDSNLGSNNHERYVGLAGNFGKVRIGTMDSIHDDAISGANVFNNKHAQNRYSIVPNSRTNNTVRYDSNEIINGLTVSASLTAGGSTDPILNTTPGNFGAAGNLGLTGGSDSELDIGAIGVNYAHGSVSLNAAHTSIRQGDVGGSTISITGVGAGVDLGSVDVNLSAERISVNNANLNNVWVSATTSVSDKIDLLAGVGIINDEDFRDEEDTSFALGAHYNHSARTQSYIEYTSASANLGGAASNNRRWLNVGVKHSFGKPRR